MLKASLRILNLGRVENPKSEIVGPELIALVLL